MAKIVVGILLQAVGLRLHKKGPGQRIHAVDHAAFVSNELLGAQRDLDGVLAGQGQGFVHTVGMKALGATQHRGQCLPGSTDDVILGLLGCQAAAGSLRMEAEKPAPGVCGPKGLAHFAGPDAARSPELAHFFEKIIVRVEKEGKAWGKVIDIDPPLDTPAHILEPISQGKGQFLGRRGPCLSNVVAADADGVPAGQVSTAILKGVHHQPHRGLGRKDELLLGDILFQDVVLDRPAQDLHGDTPFFGHDDVHRPDHGCGAVDGHGGGDFVHGNAVEQDFHVGQAGDGYPTSAKLTLGLRVVGVIAVQRRHVKGDRKPGFAMVQQVLVAGVGLLGRAKSGEHAHRPQPAPVHRGVHTPGARIFAGKAKIAVIVEFGHIQGGIKAVNGRAGGRHEPLLPLGMPSQRAFQQALFPLLGLLRERL